MKPVNQSIRINLLRLLFVAMLPVLLFVKPIGGPDSFWIEVLEPVGISLLVMGVLGRFWSILYVGSRKNKLVVTDGPYSITRNPLYLFSSIAAFGIGLMMGTFTVALLVGGGVTLVLYITARKEARFLRKTFGADYDAYAETTPFFFPDLRKYRTEDEVTFSVRALTTNLNDALVFLAFIPIAEVLEMLRADYLATWLQVY